MNTVLKEFLITIFCILCVIGTFVSIPITANHDEKEDYNSHAKLINHSIILNHDTVTVLEWRTGRYDKNRGYVLSNGMTVDEIIVKQNLIK